MLEMELNLDNPSIVFLSIVYLHFESLNESLHLRFPSYFHEQIDLCHAQPDVFMIP